jgi:hypothetical protein
LTLLLIGGRGLEDSLAAAVTPAAVTSAFYHLKQKTIFSRIYFELSNDVRPMVCISSEWAGVNSVDYGSNVSHDVIYSVTPLYTRELQMTLVVGAFYLLLT